MCTWPESFKNLHFSRKNPNIPVCKIHILTQIFWKPSKFFPYLVTCQFGKFGWVSLISWQVIKKNSMKFCVIFMGHSGSFYGVWITIWYFTDHYLRKKFQKTHKNHTKFHRVFLNNLSWNQRNSSKHSKLACHQMRNEFWRFPENLSQNVYFTDRNIRIFFLENEDSRMILAMYTWFYPHKPSQSRLFREVLSILFI